MESCHARWRGARFAYDVSLSGPRLYVASGLDGVTVLDAGGAKLTVLGLTLFGKRLRMLPTVAEPTTTS